MKRLIILFIVTVLTTQITFSQMFSLSDSTIIFKNQEGQVLTRDEVREFMKGGFNIRQEIAEGKKDNHRHSFR